MDELEQLHFERLDAFPGSVAATARREYVLIEELVPGALAPAPSAAGPACRCEVHVSQLMPVASDVPVPPYASDQPVWAQCPATGRWARGSISSLSEQHFHTGCLGLCHAVAWERWCRRSCAACVGETAVSVWSLQPRVDGNEPVLLPAQEPGADSKREWRAFCCDFCRHLSPCAGGLPRAPRASSAAIRRCQRQSRRHSQRLPSTPRAPPPVTPHSTSSRRCARPAPSST